MRSVSNEPSNCASKQNVTDANSQNNSSVRPIQPMYNRNDSRQKENKEYVDTLEVDKAADVSNC